jgi:outer membrane protein assembly factor BamB
LTLFHAGRLLTAALLFAAAPFLFAQTQIKTDVLTQHNDNARTGTNLHETLLTPANVNSAHFGLLHKLPVDDQLYTQPLVATNILVNGGTHDLVFVTTVNNSVYAFDANDPGDHPLWHVNFGTPANLYDADFNCTDINGNMGIIGTPVIDRSRNALYVVALTHTSTGFQQRLHALDLATGADLPNSPATITAPAFDPLMQNQRPALALANGNLYIGYASHCDKEPYHGFLFAYDAASLHQTAVLNTSPTGEGASIWHSGQAPAIDPAGNLYVVTGNGSWDGTSNFSESFLKLDPHLHLLDWFTPTNHLQLDKDDNDLDSSGATLLPGTNRVIGGGKEGVLYSLNTNHLGHLGDEHSLQHFPATSSHLHSIVFWHSDTAGDLLYIWGQRDKARTYKVSPTGTIDPTPITVRPQPNEGHPGAMLSLSANDGHDGILWAAIHATGDSWHESRPGILHAYLADDIQHELWNSWQLRARDDCGNYSKMAPPTIANGKVFLASFGDRNTGTGQLCIYGLLPSGPPPATPATLSATTQGSKFSLTWRPSPTAETYTIFAAATPAGPFRPIAAGLTTPALNSIPSERDLHVFTVRAHNANGDSAPSTPIAINLPATATQRPMIMH